MSDESEIVVISKAWIDVTKNPDSCSDELFDLGFSLNSLCYDDPEKAWIIIKMIKNMLDNYYFETSNEEKERNLAANLGSGPLETLLSQHGIDFIDRVEAAAVSDDKFRWILGCVWKNAMTEDIWQRVQNAVGNISR